MEKYRTEQLARFREALKRLKEEVDSAPFTRVFYAIDSFSSPTDATIKFRYVASVCNAKSIFDVFNAMQHPNEDGNVDTIGLPLQKMGVGDLAEKGGAYFLCTSTEPAPAFEMVPSQIYGVLLHRFAIPIGSAEERLGSKLEPLTREPEPEAVMIPSGPVLLNF